jgi:CRISPR-associated endoribonuclease Cas6
MRLALSLRPDRVPCTISFDYAHALTAVVYGFLDSASHDYARFLHDEGYRSGTKRFKLFTFSQLLVPDRKIEKEGLVCLSSEISWQISSPISEFIEHLAQGLLSLGRMRLGENEFGIERVEVLLAPRFLREMSFRSLSPIVVAVGSEREGKFGARYLRADDPELSEAIRKNLLKKFVLVHGREPASHEFVMEFDGEYLRRKAEEIYRLVNYKSTKIKAIMAPFTVRGSAELIAMGYEAGFGEKNSMGFGMVEVIQSSDETTSALSRR